MSFALKLTQRAGRLIGQRTRESLEAARAGVAAFRDRERPVALPEVATMKERERIEWDQVEGVDELSTTIQFFYDVPRRMFYVVGEDGTERPYVTDSEAELAAIRALGNKATDFGPSETWLVKGYFAGKPVTRIYHGPLSALRALWPDAAERIRQYQAGVQELDELAGIAFVIERLPRIE